MHPRVCVYAFERARARVVRVCQEMCVCEFVHLCLLVCACLYLLVI